MMVKVIHCFLLITVLLVVVLAHQDDTQVGSSVTLPCQDNHYRNTPSDLLDIHWWTGKHLVLRFHNGRISQGSRFINRADLSAEGLRNADFSVSITPTEYSDSGCYICVLTQEGRNVTLGEVDLKIKAPRSQSAVFVKSGQRVILSCFGHVDWSDSEAAFVQWKRWSQVVLEWKSGSLFVDAEFDGRVSVPKERILYGDLSLIFNDTHPDDQGYYMCFFKGNNDIRPSTIINLTVTEQMSRVNKLPGSQLELPLPDESPLVLCFLPDSGNYTVSLCEVEKHQLMCSKPYSNRMLLQNNSLILTNVSSTDIGTFFLRDRDTFRTRNVLIVQILSIGTENVPFGPIRVLAATVPSVLLVGLAYIGYLYYKRQTLSRNHRENVAEKESEIHPLQDIPHESLICSKNVVI